MNGIADFHPILQATLTPVALISGIGLLLLSMVNRYNHAIDRVRQLLKDRPMRQGADLQRLDASVDVIFRRCRMMRNAILCVGMSIASSGAMVFITALEGLFALDAFPLFLLKALLLIIAIGLVVIAAVMFVIEITYSLHALELELTN